jgi:3-hydroxyacyl-[acyl-carrier-protein] dehydratase
MRFHLIDRVDACEPGKSVRARKLVSRSEESLVGPADDPIIPPPLVLEALCQAGTWLIMITTERRQRAALLSIGTVEFLGDARPGDIIILEGNVESWGDEVAVISGQATVDGTPILTASEIMCILIDANDLADPDETARLQQLFTRS